MGGLGVEGEYILQINNIYYGQRTDSSIKDKLHFSEMDTQIFPVLHDFYFFFFQPY